MADLDPLIREYYERGEEAASLASLGHQVHVVDPVALHVEQARASSEAVTAEVGDARALTQGDASVDAVLLLGPLYHLVDRADRLAALGEARRVLKRGGVLFAAAISRFAALLNLLMIDRLHEPAVLATVEAGLTTGLFRGSDNDLFTTAYLHRPDELQREIAEAGFTVDGVFNIEGPGFMVADFEDRWRDEPRRRLLLHVARLVENEPLMMGASSHLLAVARR